MIDIIQSNIGQQAITLLTIVIILAFAKKLGVIDFLFRKNGNGVDARIDKIETNHLPHIQSALDKLDGKIDRIEEKLDGMQDRCDKRMSDVWNKLK